ncbi:TetR/AcrR family transcriptional regulator [Ruegeria jejuensis]|uniref:TetR/AcrR family transcriptional regulator n=1 Tax=Ruegeria jejuensis TaxID=3233338 RepID=UPI00355C8FC1
MSQPPTNQPRTKDRIVATADEMFYHHGFAQTSFADIAARVGISRGNFYHHFKTKDDILRAVIALRLMRTQAMLADWEADAATPRECIERFIDILIMNRTKISRHGCPVGTLSTELTKLDHAAQGEANALFTLFRTWLRTQFEALGRTEEADALALHLLARSQGAATMAQAFGEEQFLYQEVERMCDWLDQIAA